MAVPLMTDEAWIHRFHPSSQGEVELICFPHAGGAASFWFPLSAALGENVEVLAVQYPGRHERYREPCIDDLGALADAVFTVLRPHLERPVALLGHSLGAILAFEVARRLEAGGVRPVTLFASGRRAPSCRRDESLHTATDEQLVANLQALAGTEAQVLGDPELVRLVLPALRSDYRAIETYRCDENAAVDCPVTVLTGAADPLTTAEEAAAWRQHTRSDLTVRTFTGGHFFLAEHQAAVIEVLVEEIDRSLRSRP